MTLATPAVRPARAAFFVRTLRQAPRLDPASSQRAVLGRSHRSKAGQGQAQARHRSAPAKCCRCRPIIASASCRLPTPARSKWRCGRCSARARSTCSPGNASAKTGSPTPSSSSSSRTRHAARPPTANCPISARSIRTRHRLHLERHHLRRARSQCRLDRRRPRRPDDLRRDLGRLRAAARLGRSSMSSPSPGRRCWAAKPRTAC